MKNRLSRLYLTIFLICLSILFTGCHQNFSKSELTENFYYIGDQYSSVWKHSINKNITENFDPQKAKLAKKRINARVEKLKNNSSYPGLTKDLIKFGKISGEALTEYASSENVDDVRKDEATIVAPLNISSKIIKKYYKHDKSKKIYNLKALGWKPIDIDPDKTNYKLKDDIIYIKPKDGYVTIIGKANPHSKITSQDKDSFFDTYATANSKGEYKLKIFFPSQINTPCVLKYVNPNAIISEVEECRVILKPGRQKESTSNTTSNSYVNNTQSNDSNNKTADSNSSNQEPAKTNPTTEQKKALKRAKYYILQNDLSADGIRKQLENDKFSEDDIQYALANIDNAMFGANALNRAKYYQNSINMSPAGIREQLQYDGFNAEQIDFAIRHLSN